MSGALRLDLTLKVVCVAVVGNNWCKVACVGDVDCWIDCGRCLAKNRYNIYRSIYYITKKETLIQSNITILTFETLLRNSAVQFENILYLLITSIFYLLFISS